MRAGIQDQQVVGLHRDPPVVRTHGLTRRFGPHSGVFDLSFEVARGEIFGLLGHNGAGKTTTIRLLNGLLASDRGDVQVLGSDPVREGLTVRRQVGVLSETPSLEERLTGRENLLFYAELYGVDRPKVQARVRDLLEFLELADAADRRVEGYSKGMRQRLAIARALLHEPQVLCLDEPTSGLDPLSARQVLDLVERLARVHGRTVLLCTHDLHDAQRLCDRVVVLKEGREVAQGAPGELVERFAVHAQLALNVGAGQERFTLTSASELGFTGSVPRAGEVILDDVLRSEVPALLAHLLGCSVDVYGANMAAATLEDVYVSLMTAGRRQ